jgi:hypothetical protein
MDVDTSDATALLTPTVAATIPAANCLRSINFIPSPGAVALTPLAAFLHHLHKIS